MGFEPMNTGFADQRVSHFAIGARPPRRRCAAEQCFYNITATTTSLFSVQQDYLGWAVIRRYGFTVL